MEMLGALMIGVGGIAFIGAVLSNFIFGSGSFISAIPWYGLPLAFIFLGWMVWNHKRTNNGDVPSQPQKPSLPALITLFIAVAVLVFLILKIQSRLN